MRQVLFLLAFAIASCSRAAPAPAPDIAQTRTAEVRDAVRGYQREFDAAPDPGAADRNTAYQFQFTGLFTDRVPMTAFEGQVVMVVNTASKCGFTPQYAQLQEIYNEYHARGFSIVGVPANNFMGQEPGSAQQIQEFCTLNYGVTFPMAAKTDVVGAQRHPFYAWAQSQIGDAAIPRWNFHKILIGRDGHIITAFGSPTEPTSHEVRSAIETALATAPPANAGSASSL